MQNSLLGNRDLIRAINRSLILNAIKIHGAIDRAALARQIGLSPATLTAITAELIEEGLVFEKQTGDSRGGRRPILLALNPRGGFVIGVKLMEHQVTGALTDLEATVMAKESAPFQQQTPEVVGAAIASLVETLLQRGDLPRKKLLGVGVGLAGIVDSARGLLRQSPFFGWRDLPLRDLLQERMGVPVTIDNDVNTLTLAEKLFGAGQKMSNFLTITIGRGVGMGIVIHGELYRGKNGGAGELGHIVVDPDGPECDCGRHGCLESYVSDHALLRAAKQALQAGDLPGPITKLDDLLALAEAGYPAARRIYAQAGQRLGVQIANLINMYDPDMVIISGEGVGSGDWLFTPMREAVACHVMPGIAADTEIRIDAWGDDAWARGAASLVLGEIFKSPVRHEAVVVS